MEVAFIEASSFEAASFEASSFEVASWPLAWKLWSSLGVEILFTELSLNYYSLLSVCKGGGPPGSMHGEAMRTAKGTWGM